MTSIRDFLTSNRVTSSAPCRIDSGGTFDIKALAIPSAVAEPTTVNVALNLRTSVVLSPYKNGWIKISSNGFPQGETFPSNNVPLNTVFSLFFAANAHFDFHGLEARISSLSPVKSAMGGSSTALVAFIKALAKVSVGLGGRKLSKREIVSLAYNIEDGVSGGNCGLQDHCAAVYGGVHQWKWRYETDTSPFKMERLLSQKNQKELSKRILVAYSGKSHISSRTNRKWVNDFLSGHTRRQWLAANEIVHHLAKAIREQDWKEATHLIQQEMQLRKKITPEALISITQKMVIQAERMGCGARFSGAGAGGSVWALGEMENIRGLREKWGKTLAPVRGGGILDCTVDPAGVK
jgi:D-glycero-alpha-D-manno-heptose-7-phosphate kinase